MTPEDPIHRLELAMERVEGEIKALRAELTPRFANVEERIVHQGNEIRQMVRAVEAEATSAHARIEAEATARANDLERWQRTRELDDERWQRERGLLDTRVATLEQWRSSLGDDFPKVIQYVRDSKAQLRLWRAFGAAATAVIVALLIALLTRALRVA